MLFVQEHIGTVDIIILLASAKACLNGVMKPDKGTPLPAFHALFTCGALIAPHLANHVKMVETSTDPKECLEKFLLNVQFYLEKLNAIYGLIIHNNRLLKSVILPLIAQKHAKLRGYILPFLKHKTMCRWYKPSRLQPGAVSHPCSDNVAYRP